MIHIPECMKHILIPWGTGNLGRYVKKEPALMDWLFAQKKENKSMTVLAGQGN